MTSRCVGDSGGGGGSSYHGVAWIQPSPIGSDISPDADGVFPSAYVMLVDISHMLARALGKQMSMTNTYRVTGLKVGLTNVNDTDDNDRGLALTGKVFWHTPTMHKVDALQAARMLERHSEEDQIDGDSPFFNPNSSDYRGFRFNWNDDDQVKAATDAGDVNGWLTATGHVQWNLAEILELYGESLGDVADTHSRALFNYRTGGPSLMRFALSYNNAMHQDGALTTVQLIENPQVNDFVFQAEAGRHIEVLGGLLALQFETSNTLPNGDVSPDDYDIQVELTVEGWSSW
ncbi:MAG TPA: hypothetical protein EYN66_19760 [Myxococcales bacterium]|nr:hypothetical protein [Myxococcales bacterium]